MMKKVFKVHEKDYNSFLVHLQGQWHSGTARYIQNRKFSGLNPFDALVEALEPNLITRLPVTFESCLK